MKITSSFLAILAILALTDQSSAQDAFSMKGVWTGHRERISQTDGYRKGDATLVVNEQTGLTFKGFVKWSTPGGDMQDDVVGAFTPGGRLIGGSDAEGTYDFALVDPNTLDYCYSESGPGFRTTCATLTRQP